MSVIFQTLQKLHQPSVETVQRRICLNGAARPHRFASPRLRDVLAGLGLFGLFVFSGIMLYLIPGGENSSIGQNHSATGGAIANASVMPLETEPPQPAVYMPDTKVKKETSPPANFVFLPPERRRTKAAPSVPDARRKPLSRRRPVPQKYSDGSAAVQKKEPAAAAPVMSERQIVKKIEAAMIEGKNRRAEELLEQLAAVMGEDSIYVMKLRAYFLLRTGENPLAVALLKKVLADNANDVEAGINMAVLEIRSKKYLQARERLVRLKNRHPENRLVTNLLNRLDR